MDKVGSVFRRPKPKLRKIKNSEKELKVTFIVLYLSPLHNTSSLGFVF